MVSSLVLGCIWDCLDIEFSVSQPLDDLWIPVVKKGAFVLMEHLDGLHFFFAELKIKYLEIFLNPFFSDGFRDGDDATLDEPTKDYLGNGFVVVLPNRSEEFIGKKAVFPFGKGSPRFDLDLVFLQKFLGLDLLVKGMRFDLTDRWDDFVEADDVHHAIRLEVAETYGPRFSLAIQVFHGSPGSMDVPVGLMDQIEIQVFHVQALQRFLKCHLGFLVSGVMYPEFGSEEKFFA